MPTSDTTACRRAAWRPNPGRRSTYRGGKPVRTSGATSVGNQIRIRPRYDNFIGGQWVAPVKGQYFTNLTPITGKPICQVARSTSEDIELALDAAHKAKDKWARTSPAERAGVLLKIADKLEANLKLVATAETLDNGKPIRETMAADIPLAIDHFRYFAGCIRAQEGAISEIDHDTIAYHFHEPLGVVGQIIPWNFPILMAAWKLAPAIAAGNCVVLKPAEQTPMGIMVVMDLIGDILPPGVLNVVNGFGVEAGKPLALIAVLANRNGPLLFHQSGGCCDGSAPMCYPAGELRVGGQDVQLVEIGGMPFYMSASQFEYWQHTHLVIDVVKGRGSGFTLEAPEGVRFLTRSRMFTEQELAELEYDDPARACTA